MTSRLDRLFVLLEGGAGAATRRAAARQLGEVQKAHPEELHRLLGRLMKHLRSPCWDTRVAAAQAVEAILANVPEWHPPPFTDDKEENIDEESGMMRCETFDLQRVLQHGQHLMGSEGNEYDLDEEPLCGSDINEKLAKQRQQLNARLGLDVAANLGVDLSSVYTNEDLCPQRPQINKTETTRRPVQELVPIVSSKPLSSREMNLAKRKARAAFSKQKSRDCSEETPSAPPTPPIEPDRKKIKLEPVDEFVVDKSLGVPDWSGSWGACARWPLAGWCAALQAQLFSAAWEARHGAASALRELLRARVARSAGHRAGATPEQKEEAHQRWLEDLSLRLLCVLALDRFGDFVSDQVVAPVRESCAQALGVAAARAGARLGAALARQLALLRADHHWEARHGALLAYKYLLQARQELACAHGALEHLMAGLSDRAEDVSAVAALALAPAARALAARRPGAVRAVVRRLAQLLRHQDDLAAAANSYMALLAALLALPEPARLLHPIDLTDMLPRLWPYLDHNTSSVRKATLQTLRTLTRPLLSYSNGTNGDASHEKTDKESTKNEDSTKINDDSAENNDDSAKINDDSAINNEDSAKINDDSVINNDDSAKINDGSANINDDSAENNDECAKSNDESTRINDESTRINDEITKSNDDSMIIDENKCSDDDKLMWTPELLQEAMRHVYQRVLFEHVHDIQEIAVQVWCNLVQHARLRCVLEAACPMLAGWLCAAMTPARLPVDAALLLVPPHKERRQRTNSQSESLPPELRPSQKWFVGGSESQPTHARDRNVTRARCLAANVLGLLSCYLVQPAPDIEYKPEDESPIDCYVKVMVVYLRSGSALQRLVASLVVSWWARHAREKNMMPPPMIPLENKDNLDNDDISRLAPPLLVTTLHTALNQTLYYDEVALNCNRILQEARDLLAMMKHYKLPVDGEEFNNILRLEQVIHMTTVTQPMVAAMKLKRVAQTLEERRKSLQTAVNQCTVEQSTLNVSVQAALASACASLHCLPEKLNPVIRPLMESIKKEPSEELQTNSADALAILMSQLVNRDPCPNNKVLVNLKAFLRCDPEFTPRVLLDNAEENGGDSGSGESSAEGKAEAANPGPALDKYNGIVTLWEQQRGAERLAPRRGRPPAAPAASAFAALAAHEDEARKILRIQRRGATFALTSLVKYFGDELPEKLPKLWEFISQPFEKIMTDEELESMEVEAAEEMVSRLQVVEAVCGAGSWLVGRAGAWGGACAALTRARHTALRHMAARALAALAALSPPRVMLAVVRSLLPALAELRAARARCGAAEALARVTDALQLAVVPYIVVLVVPLLARMSDPCEAVRLMSTRCFASLIQLMPLDGAAAEPPDLDPDLRARRLKDKEFLEQLFNPKLIKDYKIPVPVSAELRSYQQAGVNWLRFLYSYGLHGVLCDDMGLGKTLQSLVVAAGAALERQHSGLPPLPSLVVCPPTLTGHWVFEVNKFIPSKFLKPLQYVGPPVERERLRCQVKHYNFIVASYDIVRKDISFFSSIKWNYCILDEGHVIKNGKTKAFKAIKQLIANHRLILSGTPIQNNVLELWSLFDFLMPGLLGTERQFTARYSRPILAARDPRATTHQLQAGALACEALHRQVLPFLLRRVKEDVLKELPPKITQDYYCELSPLQRRLYEDFSRQHMPQAQDITSHTHVFQALHYLQNVCNHPKLVLTADHPEASNIARELQSTKSTLDDIDHSAKLPALKQLLLDCGIGTTNSDVESETVVSQHRALIFCQLKKMLDIVERDLLQQHLPSVTYLRLDGKVPPHQRHAIVSRFNNDVSIDLLLLTTAVGGLGLNLTGADTVIFVEHDWNPMKDLQAMDRAHRIGQKKVVNVYRLITRDTLEEKIMGLQKFKLLTANTVISGENAAMETMGTDQLLDLFNLSSANTSNNQQQQPGTKSILETLPDLWDDTQYEEEYDMTTFIQGLNKMKS